MRIPRALVVTTLALVATLLSPVSAQAEGSATISGVVSDRDHAPVAGTVVSAYSLATKTERTTTVDALGAYALVADPGAVYVCFEPPAAADVDRECWEDSRFSLDAKAVSVAEGEARTGIDAVLDASSHLRGTVTDTRGNPVAGLAFGTRWRSPSSDGDNVVFSSSVEGTTNAQGHFDIRLDTYGDWNLCASDPQQLRYLHQCWLDRAFHDVPRGGSVDGVAIVLPDSARVSGRVTTRDGRSPAGVRVSLGTDGRFSTTVGRDGRWSFQGPRRGTYDLTVTAPAGRYVSQRRAVTLADDAAVVAGVDTVLAVGAPLRARTLPRIVGRMVDGSVVRARRPAWDGQVTSTTVQWYVGSQAVRTDKRPLTLYLRPWMVGKAVTVVVRASTTRTERTPGVAVSKARVVRRDPVF